MPRLGKAHLKYRDYDILKAAFEDDYGYNPSIEGGYANNEGDKYSFGLNNYIYFCVDMYAMSSDTQWLTDAEIAIDKMLNNTDVLRESRGEITIEPAVPSSPVSNQYYQAPNPHFLDGTPVAGWSSYNGVSGDSHLRCQVLIDGQITAALAYWADYVLDNNITAFIAKANTVFAQIKTVIDSHNPSYQDDFFYTDMSITVEGSYYYPNRFSSSGTLQNDPLAFNHCGGMLQSAILYHKHFNEPDYLYKAQRFMDFTRTHRTYFADTDRFEWGYRVTGEGGTEDVNHGSYSLTFMYIAYKNGYLGITHQEMTRYANALLYAWKNNGQVGQCGEDFDGAGTIPTSEAFDVGVMGYLAEFNADVAKMGRDVISTRHINNYLNMYRGYASLLRFWPNGVRK